MGQLQDRGRIVGRVGSRVEIGQPVADRLDGDARLARPGRKRHQGTLPAFSEGSIQFVLDLLLERE